MEKRQYLSCPIAPITIGQFLSKKKNPHTGERNQRLPFVKSWIHRHQGKPFHFPSEETKN